MTQSVAGAVREACELNSNDPSRRMDILHAVQRQLGWIPPEAIDAIAQRTGIPRVSVADTASFYSFFSTAPQGKVTVRLCSDIVDEFVGADATARKLRELLNIDFGSTTDDGVITLLRTPAMGMSDQAPAALVNDVVLTHLTEDKVPSLVESLRRHGDPRRLVTESGDGNNSHPLVQAMVKNNIRSAGPVLLTDYRTNQGLEKTVHKGREWVIRELKDARLRGRGGAGFPTGMKWDFARHAPANDRFVLCNADEGEPGTFKDRVLLTEYPDMVFEGMTIAGYAIGSSQGIFYLRAEYDYLRPFLEHVLDRRRSAGLLGKNICRKDGFSFDIRIQMGAGAYICGEETALISSCEGDRGDPRTKPPFPTQHGYRGHPSVINNVETLCCAVRVAEKGADWFTGMGTQDSSGTKLLSVCGDCRRPGVYEVPFGISLREVLTMAEAEAPSAVVIGGAAGAIVGPTAFERTICYSDLPTGGAIVPIGPNRDLLAVVDNYMEFFQDESCGYCTPCRVGNPLLRQALSTIRQGKGEKSDVEYLRDLAQIVKFASRCGLGQTSPNPILSTLENFPEVYEQKLVESPDGRRLSFDLDAELSQAREITERGPGTHR